MNGICPNCGSIVTLLLLPLFVVAAGLVVVVLWLIFESRKQLLRQEELAYVRLAKDYPDKSFFRFLPRGGVDVLCSDGIWRQE